MIGLPGVTGLEGIFQGAASSSLPGSAGATAPASPFSGLLNGLVHETSDLNSKAQDSVTGLLNGSGIDVHQAMIATQKADMAFELALQVRNKAVGAYQQMMAMPF